MSIIKMNEEEQNTKHQCQTDERTRRRKHAICTWKSNENLLCFD